MHFICLIVVTVVTSYWTPPARRDAFFDEIRILALNGLSFAIAPTGEDPRAEEPRILKQIATMQASAVQPIAGSLDGCTDCTTWMG